MSAQNNGGPAFPDPGRAQSAKQRERLTATGMTLRDYFAAKFMQGFIQAPDREEQYSHVTKQGCAELAYQMADAMLAERAK